MITLTKESTVFIIGENKRDNWDILENSDDNDIFFHLSSFSSCFVIMRSSDLSILHIGANLCKQHTKYKNVPNIYVDYTTVSNVKKGSNVGEIIYKSPKKVHKIKV